jgi:hypothetical protein
VQVVARFMDLQALLTPAVVQPLFKKSCASLQARVLACHLAVQLAQEHHGAALAAPLAPRTSVPMGRSDKAALRAKAVHDEHRSRASEVHRKAPCSVFFNLASDNAVEHVRKHHSDALASIVSELKQRLRKAVARGGPSFDIGDRVVEDALLGPLRSYVSRVRRSLATDATEAKTKSSVSAAAAVVRTSSKTDENTSSQSSSASLNAFAAETAERVDGGAASDSSTDDECYHPTLGYSSDDDSDNTCG